MAVEFIDAEPAAAGVEFLDEPTGAGVEFLPDKRDSEANRQQVFAAGQQVNQAAFGPLSILGAMANVRQDAQQQAPLPYDALGDLGPITQPEFDARGEGGDINTGFAGLSQGLGIRPTSTEGIPGLLAGGVRGLENVIEGSGTPVNIAAIPLAASSGIAATAAKMGFGVPMVKHTIDTLLNPPESGSVGEAAERWTETLAGGYLGYKMVGAGRPSATPLQAKSLASIGIVPETDIRLGVTNDPFKQPDDFGEYYTEGRGADYEGAISTLRKEIGLLKGEAAFILDDPYPREAIELVLNTRRGGQHAAESPEHIKAYHEMLDQSERFVQTTKSKYSIGERTTQAETEPAKPAPIAGPALVEQSPVAIPDLKGSVEAIEFGKTNDTPEARAAMQSELDVLSEKRSADLGREDFTDAELEAQSVTDTRINSLKEALNWKEREKYVKERVEPALESQDLVAREPLIDPEKQSEIPEHLRTDPELARLLNEPEAKAETVAPEEAGALIEKAVTEMKKPSGEGGFVNLDILADAGRAIYRKGIEFMEWSKEMIRSLGEAVKPHLDALWKSVSGQNIKPEFRESGGIFGVGKRVQPKGSTPLGDKEFIRIPTALKRAFRGLEREGSADVIGKTKNKVGQLLGKAIRKHVDTEQEIYGQHAAKFQKAVGKRTAASDKAFDELKPYLAAKENGRPLPALSGSAKRILGAWEDIAEETGLMAEAHKVQVFDPKINGHRPMHRIGRAYVPRMLKPEVERVMSDPQADPKLWNDLVDEISTQRGIPTDEAANYLRSEAGRFQSSDFMGNLEMARTAKLPEMFYEYDLRRIASRYLPSFAERMSQIIAYGQRLGTRDNPSRPNLWDIARKESEDAYTQKWLNSAEDQAVNLRPNGPAGRVAVRAQTLANAMLLSSPTTTVVRNLLSGLSATTEILGIRRSLAPLLTTATRARARLDAKEIGAIRDNIADFLHADQLGHSLIDDAIRSVTSTALKYSGYNGSETFVRSHGALVASQFAKDGIASISAKPSSGRAREALAVFKRMGVDAAEIVKEKADWKTGPETRKFIRTIIRDSQGGYRFDQVPLWANGPVGRFLYQFGRYGTQRARNIWNNGVKPIVGTEVEWNGKKMVHRDVRPAIKMAASAVILGETFALIASGLFGRDRRDASIKEIRQAWDEDQKTAVGLAMQRALNDIIMAGTLGIWSQPVDFVKTLKDQSRFKNPAEPPGLASTKALMQLGMDALDQKGNLTMNDFLRFSSSVMPGPKQAVDVARNVFDEPLYEAQNDVRTLRNAAQRWATRSKMDIPAKPAGGFRKSENAPHYEKIQEALLVGDSKRARVLADKFIESQEDEKKANENLRSSVRNRQPFRAGPYTSAQYREDFMEWASKNLPKEDLEQARRIQERYMEAASDAELLR